MNWIYSTPKILLFFVLTLSQTAFAEQEDFSSIFQNAAQLYQQQKYTEAEELFKKALQLEPRSEQALTNLGLTAYQLGKKGEALALLRSAMSVNPNLNTPRLAHDFIFQQLPVKEIPHEIQWFERIRNSVLRHFSLNALLGFTLLLLFSAGWLGINHFQKKRQAEAESLPYPNLSVTLFLSLLGLLLFVALSILKLYDFQQLRGTVTVEKVAVRSAADENSPELFDLYEGLEVIILQQRETWIQITYPGALSGWIPKDTIRSHEVDRW